MAPFHVLSCIVALVLTSTVAHQPRAVVTLYKGNEAVGEIDFIQLYENGPVVLNGTIRELAEGDHGLHVHEFGDVRNGCKAAGGHFNPWQTFHGAPTDMQRHVGDLGNIKANSAGVAFVSISDHLISLSGHHRIIGRALVVHSKTDDLGRGGTDESRKTGSAGSRVACGVIGIQSSVVSPYPPRWPYCFPCPAVAGPAVTCWWPSSVPCSYDSGIIVYY